MTDQKPATAITDDPDKDDTLPPSARDLLIEIGASGELWHDTDFVAYATVSVGDHHETYKVRSSIFRRYLIMEYGRQHPSVGPGGKALPSAPGEQQLRDALDAIEAAAMQGDEHEVHVRIARRGKAVYIDMGQSDWRVVKITKSGFKIVNKPLVKFVRPKGFRPLSRPVRGRSLRKTLRPLINVKDDEDFNLIVGWLVGSLSGRGPYPIMVVNGEQGSAKSTLCRVLRRLLDPNLAEVRSMPRTERDLVIAAQNSHVLAFDNLSSIPEYMSNAMCQVSTGVGFATRTLYKDSEETIFASCRPQIMNGIPDLATRSDLADRSIVLSLPAITESTRMTESEFWKDFDQRTPKILGALYDAVACALSREHRVLIPGTPRMADFARWVEAAAPPLGRKQGEFLQAYEKNRKAIIETTVDADLFASAVRRFAVAERTWTGRMSELLEELEDLTPQQAGFTRSWPKTASSASSRLRQAMPGLRELGVTVVRDRRKDGTYISLQHTKAKDSTKAKGRHQRHPRHRPIRERPML